MSVTIKVIHRRAARSLAATALSATMVIASCGSDAITSGPDDDRVSEIYTAALDWVLENQTDLGSNRPDWVMYVIGRGDEPIDVDVQATVVANFESRVEIRFVDERSEAVDAEISSEPVRDEGLLVGLGTVSSEGDAVELYVDIYRSHDDALAWQMEVSRRDPAWQVADDPVPADLRPVALQS